MVRLKDIVDSDGLITQIAYLASHPYSTNLIQQVTDPYGRTATLAYDDDGVLTNITDAGALGSSFIYDPNLCITNMTTPYGTTRFQFTEASSPADDLASGRSVRIMQPDGNCQLYVNMNSAPGVPSSYPTGEVPDTSPWSNTLDVQGLDLRNSFHWNPRQYAALGTRTNISDLTSGDFLLARMRHFLADRIESGFAGYTGYVTNFSSMLSLERQPSPDGTAPGQKTWYDYEGKPTPACDGTQAAPLFVAQVLPDGSTHFTRTEHNGLGWPTRVIETWSAGAAGTVLLRTNTFTYATNSIDLLQATNALGVQVVSNAYNAYHQVLTNYNALGEMSVFTYNGNQEPSTVSRASGLVTSCDYFTSGDASNRLASVTDYTLLAGSTVINYRTNAYKWTNGLVFTRTNPRGLTLTNTWDALQRLRRVDYPDGTFITNTYDKLDLVQVVDRMGFSNSFAYNAVRQLTDATDANGVVTHYTWCACGALESVTRAYGTPVQQVTQYYYDNQGNRTQTVGPDSYTVNYNYNALGQLTNVADAVSTTTNWYNNQGLRSAVSNAFGCSQLIVRDALDRATNHTDANAVTVTNTFDDLDRLLTRGYPDGGVEQFGYTPNIPGVTSYTNQLGSNVVNYGYDALGRKLTEAYPSVTTNQFTYAPADDLLTLTDGKNQTTTWVYDEHGRVTNKLDAASNLVFLFQYDANSRLTSRWTPAKGNTAYRYDAVGNLTNIDHSVGTGSTPSVSLAYDPLNRLTTMVDGVGTTTYGYNAADQLLSEDGPWASDTLSYAYNNRLRASMSVSAPNASAWTQSYGYDGAKRLTSTTSPAGSFTYGYASGIQNLVSSIQLPNGAFITNSYDTVARLLSTALKNGAGAVLNSHAYAYDLASQRTRQTRTAGDYVDYTYDTTSQLLTASGKESGGSTSRLHERFGYAYDAAGNLNYRTNNALVEAFGVNSLNELTAASRTGTLTVAGTTTSPATNVMVNGQTAGLYGDATFAKDGFTLVDGTNTFTAIAQDSYGRRDTNTSICYLPSAISLAYDANGNLTTNDTEVLQYDDENQLVTNWVAGSWKSEFVYDGLHRRRIQRDYAWLSAIGNWQLTNETRLVYDGATVRQHRDANNLPALSLTRGLDLSRSLHGAGGIGGLLAMTESPAVNPVHSYYHSDGNGNVTCLVTSNQAVVARAIYDPYGGFLSLSGPKVSANPYWFSSKPVHWQSGKYDFLSRWYAPELQRCLNRDPVGELGGLNLYIYVANNAVSRIDPLGLEGNPIMGLGGSWNNNYFGPGGSFYSPGYLYAPSGPPPESEASRLYGQGLNNTLSGTGQALGQILYDLMPPFTFRRSSDEYARIANLMWNVKDTPENPDATPWMRCAFNVSAMAAGNAALAGTWSALELPTMSIGWAPTVQSPGIHFFWSVETSEGVTYLHTISGASSSIGVEATWGGYIGGSSSITGIPVLFPEAAAATRVPGFNCLTGACGAARRGVLGF